jgi:proteasome accessory factor A
VITAPLAIALFAVLWLTAFSKIRRQLTPFLVSRAVIAGSGSIDEQGNFLLADKALAMNCLTGFGGLLGDRPIYCLGHFFKAVYADAWLAPQQYFRLFRRRQRLQIALGDSNLADVAEYLRVGTTLLVIDAIEAGELPLIPRASRPIRSLHAVASDPSLAATIDLEGNRCATALDLQRFYWHACRRCLEKRPDAPHEASDVLRRWEVVLDRLAEDPQSLIGSLDWVTKQFVLEKSGRGATWEAKKKIDLRYHELSPQGYFQRLRATGVVSDLLEPGDIEHARRNPPSGSPAAIRGRYIREFASDDEPITANWHAVFLGQGREAKVVRLDCYHAASAASRKSKAEGRKSKGN